MSYKFISYDKRPNEHLALITMNRPEVLNAMNPASTEEMTEIWDDFANDPELWVAILTGAGDRAFTVGNDLKDRSTDSWPPKRGPTGWGGLVNRFDLYKPVIAAVNGWALGGGFELCLVSDLVIASEGARLPGSSYWRSSYWSNSQTHTPSSIQSSNGYTLNRSINRCS